MCHSPSHASRASTAGFFFSLFLCFALLWMVRFSEPRRYGNHHLAGVAISTTHRTKNGLCKDCPRKDTRLLEGAPNARRQSRLRNLFTTPSRIDPTSTGPRGWGCRSQARHMPSSPSPPVHDRSKLPLRCQHLPRGGDRPGRCGRRAARRLPRATSASPHQVAAHAGRETPWRDRATRFSPSLPKKSLRCSAIFPRCGSSASSLGHERGHRHPLLAIHWRALPATATDSPSDANDRCTLRHLFVAPRRFSRRRTKSLHACMTGRRFSSRSSRA